MARVLLALSLIVVFLAAPASAAVLDPALASAIRNPGTWQVIVSFHGGAAPASAETSLLQGLGIQQGVLFQALPMAGVLATSEQVAALAARPEVRSIWLNRALQYEIANGTTATGVDRARADAGLTQRNGGVPVDGRGVTILVNDSGIDGTHPDLTNNVTENVLGHIDLHALTTLAPVRWAEGVAHTDVGGGHGTHVAGIAAGTGSASDGAFEGVAPGADLVGFGSGLTLALLNTLGGFDYALANRERLGIRVVTNSWGDTGDVGTDFNPDDPTNIATKALHDVGVVIVFSAGNAGPNPNTITGNFKKAPWVICVAASDSNRVLANFSSRGVKDKTVVVTGSDGNTYVSEDRPTVTAPGVSVVSARAAGSALSPLSLTADINGVPLSSLPYYTRLSGTSMAAPHVAGIAALLLDANPSLTPTQVKAIVQDTADLISGREAWEVGAGFVNAYDAITAAFDLAATSRFKVKKNNKNRDAAPTPRVTVAVIDSGINPYHAFFRAGGEAYAASAPSSVTPEVLAAFGVDESHILRLTRTGNFAADYAADKAAIWDRIVPGEVYWFEGTNILAVTFAPGTRPILPDDSADTHGVGTSAAVLRANPEAIVLFVEGIADASEAFAFNHPEVDIVSTSYGPIGSIPLPYHVHNSYTGVVRNGKFHVGAADNSPSTATQDATAGPWWSLGIAGFQEDTTEGRQVLSGSLPDFVADFTQNLPYCDACESGGMRNVSGTSFATPRTAGALSRILLETRRMLGHAGGIQVVNGVPVMAKSATRTVSNWQIRRALEDAAYYPAVVDYTPGSTSSSDLTSVPVLDPTPWSQVGWGAVTTAPEHKVIDEALAHLGLRGQPTRYKDFAACQWMTAQMQARHAYWDVIAVESESWLGSEDPYLYCGQ